MTSFEEALNRLELEEEDLKRLISAGEIRAFREGSNMRLDATDVQKVAVRLGVGSDVDESSASEVLEVEELSLDSTEDDGMVTTQLSETDTLLDVEVDAVEEVAVEETIAEAGISKRSRRNRSGASSKSATVPQAVMTDEGNGMRAALIVTALILVLAIPFAIGMIQGRSSGFTQGVVEMLGQ